MTDRLRACPDCTPAHGGSSRREFLRATGAGAMATAAATAWPVWATAADAPAPAGAAETTVKALYESLTDQQRTKMCYEWDYQDPKRGLLRTRVANNWNINEVFIDSDFYTADQKHLIRQVFEGILSPDWHSRIDQQLDDDAGGYGNEQSIAIFGQPGTGKFEFVMTGRHITLRCDGDSADHVAFGGPIFYGHAAQGFNEAADHPGNVFWHQALAANKVGSMLDGKQRERAMVKALPKEEQVAFRGQGRPGIPVADLAADQVAELQKVLKTLLDPYRQSDRDEVVRCLDAQGGLAGCNLAFYQDGDIGSDGVWDCWRLEGPAFVWYYRGAPHVHVWVNVADDPSVVLNA